ncbi:hypothetical protein [Bifidobacterium callimiconis]|uniref:Uncharacterized protein n=1 Tax=Bifidobacterium callimiconis TaxID=2306973 RepID=A0A430FI41_9BIFI|nr:hypothetical protein [Bifidobacterium callimiconis]MBT1176348.1 hypothetical protein [Bifidobacterium callimiconis]RSX52529.1 hypothetical protein D2E23_0257 [Bifidobacterium callimiconis]
MSTTIDVYPTTDYLPLVEETRSRTQELYQRLLDRYGIHSTVEVKAFYPCKTADEEIRYVDPATRWKVEMDLGFAYLINGQWRSSSWPSLWTRDRVDQSWVDNYERTNGEYGYPASMLGEVIPIEADEFDMPLTVEELRLINAQDHSWYEYRNFAGPAVPSIGYGFVAAALAEETDGRLASTDGAFDSDGHNGETAEQFLTWWGDEQMAFYGKAPFQ